MEVEREECVKKCEDILGTALREVCCEFVGVREFVRELFCELFLGARMVPRGVLWGVVFQLCFRASVKNVS